MRSFPSVSSGDSPDQTPPVILGRFGDSPIVRGKVMPRLTLAQYRVVKALLEAGDDGVIPSWAKDPKIASSLINARAETVAEKPSFRSAFKRRRCLILADGYYEWTGKPGKKQPWHFHLPDDKPFAFAGLWEHWKPPEGDPIETCVIVTTAANELASKYHDRMPVIVDSGDYARWLDPAAGSPELLPLLESRTVNGLEVAAANPLVNNPRNQGPELLVPPL
jgi:putative SOS response-associated peptidase YedK